MFWYELILALVLALVLALIVIVIVILRPSARYRTSAGVSALLFFLPLLFLLIWAGGAWLAPIGAPVMDVCWLSFLLPALFLLVLLRALSTPSAPPVFSASPVGHRRAG